MAGLHILDDGFEQELLSLPTPMAFIDFETAPARFLIPGTYLTETVPTQWSCHILYEHGLNWSSDPLEHDEWIWTGDIYWSPIYAFVQSLYEATRDAETILIYSNYENVCLDACIRMAERDIYEKGDDPDYLVVDMYGDKIPLMEIAPYIEEWCEDMRARFFDMCNERNHSESTGLGYWLQSPDFKTSNSIKKVLPICQEEFSRTQELFLAEGIPANGYKGFAAMGHIAKGDECTKRYCAALNRPPREGVAWDAPGCAPIDENIINQCLIYCRLDTLAMAVIYFAVLEATEKWRQEAGESWSEYHYLNEDGKYHALYFDGDRYAFFTYCDDYQDNPLPVEDFEDDISLQTELEVNRIPIREYYSSICPHCRKITNQANPKRQ